MQAVQFLSFFSLITLYCFIDCVAASCILSHLCARVVSFSFTFIVHIYVLHAYKWQGAPHQMQLAWLFHTSLTALYYAEARRYEASLLPSVIYASLHYAFVVSGNCYVPHTVGVYVHYRAICCCLRV